MHLPRIRLALAFAGLSAVVALSAGCGAKTPTATAPGPAAQSRPQSTAMVDIVAPRPGAVVTGPTLHVRLKLTGGQIVPQTDVHLTPNRGHIHLILDGKVVSMSYGVEQDVPVTPGAHILQAEFVATDHFPFNPRVIRVATFTAR
jgi:hypothetical protein